MGAWKRRASGWRDGAVVKEVLTGTTKWEGHAKPLIGAVRRRRLRKSSPSSNVISCYPWRTSISPESASSLLGCSLGYSVCVHRASTGCTTVAIGSDWAWSVGGRGQQVSTSSAAVAL